ncbi:serine/threonine protein kinase, CMGC group [Puccinia graminis f. sp. tritici]|uniref:non-specific serine/threonine protein kinase n=1 Tax=Puccinia graminis f. sp. tritici TaxID=56615 RepID=A0A5B0NTN7_PUCGR|nr:serine/threonine protein kinase, CMGC group [Puccinia graminis f. sp. tritici]
MAPPSPLNLPTDSPTAPTHEPSGIKSAPETAAQQQPAASPPEPASPAESASPPDTLESLMIQLGVITGGQLMNDQEDAGYHPVKIGERFHDDRYQVVRKLGEGQFSMVWLAHDQQLDRHVALKIFKSSKFFTDSAEAEIKLLERVSRANPAHPGYGHVAGLLDHFKHQGPNGSHVCLVFEPLGQSLGALIRRHKKKIPEPVVRKIGQQVLLALDYLHRECGIIHIDMKPDNVLIVVEDVEGVIRRDLEHKPTGGYDSKSSIPLSTSSSDPFHLHHQSGHDPIAVKIIDFGSATLVADRRVEGVTTRPYRSPELMLDAPWDQRIDIWSTGCMLVELLTGYLLFPAPLDLPDEHLLGMMIVLLGPFPVEVVKAGKYFHQEIAQLDQMIAKQRSQTQSLEERLLIDYPSDRSISQCILKMLQIDHTKRAQAKEILDAKGWLGSDA